MNFLLSPARRPGQRRSTQHAAENSCTSYVLVCTRRAAIRYHRSSASVQPSIIAVGVLALIWPFCWDTWRYGMFWFRSPRRHAHAMPVSAGVFSHYCCRAPRTHPTPQLSLCDSCARTFQTEHAEAKRASSTTTSPAVPFFPSKKVHVRNQPNPPSLDLLINIGR